MWPGSRIIEIHWLAALSNTKCTHGASKQYILGSVGALYGEMGVCARSNLSRGRGTVAGELPAVTQGERDKMERLSCISTVCHSFTGREGFNGWSWLQELLFNPHLVKSFVCTLCPHVSCLYKMCCALWKQESVNPGKLLFWPLFWNINVYSIYCLYCIGNIHQNLGCMTFLFK